MGLLQENLVALSRLAADSAEALDRPVERAGLALRKVFQNGGKVLVCGNGGSAADAQHFVAELVIRMGKERPSMPGISLSSDPSVVTAGANDYGFEQVFARQVEGLGREGDALLALSTSGKSPNILAALRVAQGKGMVTIVLTGEGGDPLLDSCDHVLRVPTGNTQLIQEVHMPILHTLCAIAEDG